MGLAKVTHLLLGQEVGASGLTAYQVYQTEKGEEGLAAKPAQATCKYPDTQVRGSEVIRAKCLAQSEPIITGMLLG